LKDICNLFKKNKCRLLWTYDYKTLWSRAFPAPAASPANSPLFSWLVSVGGESVWITYWKEKWKRKRSMKSDWCLHWWTVYVHMYKPKRRLSISEKVSFYTYPGTIISSC
jgi:hypothetical protein